MEEDKTKKEIRGEDGESAKEEGETSREEIIEKKLKRKKEKIIRNKVSENKEPNKNKTKEEVINEELDNTQKIPDVLLTTPTESVGEEKKIVEVGASEEGGVENGKDGKGKIAEAEVSENKGVDNEKNKSGGNEINNKKGGIKEKEVKPEGEDKQLDEMQNNLLRNVFIVMGIIVVSFLIGYYAIDSIRHFDYKGVEFNVVKEGEIIFYNTAIPVSVGNPTTGYVTADYNFYLRNDPRKLEKNVPFEGNLHLMKNIAIHSTEDFKCEGYGALAVANLVSLVGKLGGDIVRDENATCDELGRYSFIQLQPGEETSIEEVGNSCYYINIKDCEILQGTERMMIELFVQANAENN